MIRHHKRFAKIAYEQWARGTALCLEKDAAGSVEAGGRTEFHYLRRDRAEWITAPARKAAFIHKTP